MRPTSAVRLIFIAMFVGGMSFAATRSALAQTTDEAHALCAQGGGDSSLSGAGGPNVGGIDDGGGDAGSFGSADSLGDSQAEDADPDSGASGGAGGGGGGDGGGAGSGNDSAFSHASSNDDAGGSGQFGGGAGLGGSDAGGGAGGCGLDTGGEGVVRRLPVTGGSSDRVGFMGAGFVLLGGALVATRWRLSRRGVAAADGLVWDAFGTPTN